MSKAEQVRIAEDGINQGIGLAHTANAAIDAAGRLIGRDIEGSEALFGTNVELDNATEPELNYKAIEARRGNRTVHFALEGLVDAQSVERLERFVAGIQRVALLSTVSMGPEETLELTAPGFDPEYLDALVDPQHPEHGMHLFATKDGMTRFLMENPSQIPNPSAKLNRSVGKIFGAIARHLKYGHKLTGWNEDVFEDEERRQPCDCPLSCIYEVKTVTPRSGIPQHNKFVLLGTPPRSLSEFVWLLNAGEVELRYDADHPVESIGRQALNRYVRGIAVD